MLKISKIVVLLLFCSLLGLSACSAGSAREEAETKGHSEENNRKKEQDSAPKENAKKKMNKEMKPKPIFVKIIDPNTKEVIKNFQPMDFGFGKDDEKYKAEVEKWARELARGTEKKPGYDKRMTPDKIAENGKIVKGSPLVILEEEELVKNVLEASKKGGDVELPLYTTASGYAPEDAEHLDEVVVASFQTYFNPGVAGRTRNIELSADAINNVIIGSNDYFSFNTTLGPSDEAHGYQPAEEAINGKLVMGIGGGICQTSSTLFNAVDKLGVDYVEKHHHSVTVGYVPKGRDATVSYGGKDFRFQNTTGAPFLIKAKIDGGTLIVEVRTSKQYQGLMKQGV